MSGYRKCAVSGCEDKTASRHRFPNPKKSSDRFQAWLKACANEALCSLDPDLVYRSHRVCHIHFCKEDACRNNYLSRLAVPKLFLCTLEDSVICDLPASTNIALKRVPSNHVYELEAKRIRLEMIVDQDSVPGCSSTTNPDNRKSPSPLAFHGDSLLREVGVSRVVDLTPKAKKLHRRAKILKKKLDGAQRRKNNYRDRMHQLENMSSEEIVDSVTTPLNKTAADFIKSQICLSCVKPKGRRYALDSKVLALILSKTCGRGYNTLSKVLSLPSRNTLNAVLRKIPVQAGINESIFNNLKMKVSQMREIDRHCIIMFDEISLQPNIQLNTNTGTVEGFVDFGFETSPSIANHALVFMARGICKKWKQPLCYTFCKHTTKSLMLVQMIKKIIVQCQIAGLEVMATVSDQGATNIGAVNYLKKQYKEKQLREGTDYNDLYYEIEKKKILHIYDPPHLLKGIRNNLLTKDLVWGNKIATWDHIQNAYYLDNASTEFRLMPKITERHVVPEKMNKMKVAHAAQVLSFSVGSGIAFFAKTGYSTPGGTSLNNDALDTARVCHFFNKTFDSVNGHSLNTQGVPLKCAVRKNSGHLAFWSEARKEISKMFFRKRGSEERKIPSSLSNWVVTLKSLAELSKVLELKGITFFAPRSINQDPLENFFGQIRQHGFRNVNPTCQNFKNTFKALLIQNLVSKHSVSANCESDDSQFIITNVKDFINQTISADDEDLHLFTHADFAYPLPNVEENLSSVDKAAIAYISGFMVKNVKKNSCSTCNQNLFSDKEMSEWHLFTSLKEFSDSVPRKLKYANPVLIKSLAVIYTFVKKNFFKIIHIRFVYVLLQKYINTYLKINFDECSHSEELKKKIIVNFTKLCCHNYCNGINKVILGKENRGHNSDTLYIQAKEFNKRKK